MRIFDISRPLSSSLAPWPGDTPFNLKITPFAGAGSVINVGALTMSAHAGTHVDAPFHFLESGLVVSDLPLEAFIGDADVVDVTGRAQIRPEDLPPETAPRVLFRTDAWPDASVFPDSVPTLTLETVSRLAERRTLLVGVDVPSVDAIESKSLPIHHALAEAGTQILESLNLEGVPAGRYTLLALPLRIEAADASPVRAVLLKP